MYKTRRLKLEKTEQLDVLALAAGELYTRTLVSFWRTVNHKGIWLKPSSLMRWQNSASLHAHSADAVVQSFFSSLKSWRMRRKTDPKARPPKRKARYYKVQWKNSAIRLREGSLILSNGRGNEPLIIPWKWDSPKFIELGWSGKQYELRAIYLVESPEKVSSGVTVGIDLGEVHMAVAHTGTECFILNGRELRSKRRYQNKLKAKLSNLIDTKKNGSNRRKRAKKTKVKQLRKLNNQIKDMLHKQTTKLISVLKSRNTQMVVIGDVRDIRASIDYGKKTNQKLHQWTSGKVRQMLTYKAEACGMEVSLQNEAYTSQTCPCCGNRHKPSDRIYKCSKCGFQYHRDGVGGFNIRQKYLCASTVVGVMASPIGLRHKPHALCSTEV
ncbi:MAG: RNA-guided endonuclease InsQ/TnpB family protein [Dethiobacter sp.]